MAQKPPYWEMPEIEDWDEDDEDDEWEEEDDNIRAGRQLLPFVVGLGLGVGFSCSPRRFCYPRQFACRPRYFGCYPRQFCYPRQYYYRPRYGCYPRPCFPL